MKSMFPENVNLVGKVLDFQLQRQNIVSANLANMNTPGYKARRLEFEKDLQAALGLAQNGNLTRTQPNHLPAVFDPNSAEADVTRSMDTRVVQGLDNVNLDKEMGIMAKNNMQYGTLSTILQKNFSGLKTVIQEGGK